MSTGPVAHYTLLKVTCGNALDPVLWIRIFPSPRAAPPPLMIGNEWYLYSAQCDVQALRTTSEKKFTLSVGLSLNETRFFISFFHPEMPPDLLIKL
jgi:hypothetical protein